MTVKTLTRAIKKPKPAIIREGGAPRYVVLDWETYRRWDEMVEDLEDSLRLAEALADSKNQRRIPLSEVKRRYSLP